MYFSGSLRGFICASATMCVVSPSASSAPVSALFFLEKGSENRVDELSSAEAVHRLMRNILFFAEDRGLAEKLFATACDFVGRVPIRRLTFYPDARVWDAVRNFDRNFERKVAGNFQEAPQHA